jgi:hypothetical protein
VLVRCDHTIAVRRMRKKATLDARRAQLTGTLLRRRHRRLERKLAVEGTAYQQNHASLVARMPAIERQLAALEATAKRLDDPRDALLTEADGGGDGAAAAAQVQFKSLMALQVCGRAHWLGRTTIGFHLMGWVQRGVTPSFACEGDLAMHARANRARACSMRGVSKCQPDRALV